MHCGWVGWETRVFNFQAAGMSVTQCFDTKRENVWTLLILVSERMLLCSSVCGGVNIIAFSQGYIVHLSLRLCGGEALILPLSELECFSPGACKETPILGRGLQRCLGGS